MSHAAEIQGFDRLTRSDRRRSHDVYRPGSGPGVVVIHEVDMCFTGGFALAMAVEPSVAAAVLSQPARPAPVSQRRRAALGLDASDLTRVKERAKDELRVLGLRFTADRGCHAERFQTLRRELGESFESIEIDSSPGNRDGIPEQAHSVLTRRSRRSARAPDARSARPRHCVPRWTPPMRGGPPP